jgi:hypothetical protein
MKISRFGRLLVGTWAFATSASAQSPVAIVEDFKGNPSSVAFMDYLEAGKVIRLAPQDSIVLSYLKSCVREAIRGGTVKVGIVQSEVQSGQVERTKVDCDAGKMVPAPHQVNDSAGMVFRHRPPRAVRPAPDPQFTLYGLCPIVELKGAGTLVMERLDKPGERYMLAIGQKQLVRGAFFDFATNGKSLTAGGVYGATWNTHQVVFKVDRSAKSGRTPIVGRLLRLAPAS